MEYRVLGKTGLQVSEIGFGGIPLQRIPPDEAVTVVREAFRLGINFFDSARGYTDSEEKMGLALQGIPRSDIILATKSGAGRKDSMKWDVDISLRNFRTDYIDLYQLHNLRDEEKVKQIFGSGGSWEALKEAQKEGKVRFIGITGHIPSLLLEVLKRESPDTVQFPFNYIERDALDELLPQARQQGAGTIIMKPLAGGVFSYPAAALKFILRHDVSVAIPGMKSLEEVGGNAAASGAAPCEAEEEQLRQEAGIIGEKFCRRCDYCQPCPQGIDISSVMTLRRYSEGYDLHDWARERYNALKVKPSLCSECGSCEDKCPYNLPIRKLLQECSRLFES
ncbi:MAG: aldo/keto reductase [Firmicutes bacterium]|nr:aldo/keto reductase [Bacillota bacterium]